MSRVARNVAANLIGKIWTLAVSLGVVPVYLHALGVEAYGLLGIFLTLSAIFAVLDLGLGNTLNRQLAQYSAQRGREQDMHDLLRTLELIYWLIGIGIGALTWIAAPLIADHWLRPERFAREEVVQALSLMGIALAVLWPRVLYSAGLMGLQRQVAQNLVSTVMATILSVGGALIVTLVSATIQALLAWTIVVGLAEALVMRSVLQRRLPAPPRRAVFSIQQLRMVWRFAAGVTGISLLAVVLGQLDKVILSKLLTLEAFGYYSLAWRVVSGFYLLIAPVQSAFFPRFSELAVRPEDGELARAYHGASQLMSVIVLPAAAVLAVFAGELLELWTLDSEIARNSGPILAVLAVGTALNGLMMLPTSLQLAFGWTRLVFVVNAAAVALMAPAAYLLAQRFGGIGAAWLWLALNAGYVIFMLPMMHRRLLPGHLPRWILVDVGAPLTAAAIVVLAARPLLNVPESYAMKLGLFAALSSAALLAAVLAAPEVRAAIVRRMAGNPEAKPAS